MSRNNYLTEAFKSMRSDDILNEEAFTLDSKGADELKQFLDGDAIDDTISVIDPNAETPEELEDSYMGKVILDCCVCHSKLYKDKDEVVIDEDGDLANVDEECPFCYCVDGFKIVGEVKEFNKDDSDEDEKDNEDDEPKPEEKDEVEVEETEEDEKIEESVSAKRSARMKKKVRSLKEGSDGGKYFDKIAKHFYYTDNTDFLDLVVRIVSNIDFSSSDIDAKVLDAVNDGLTYFDDQWEILKEYSETPADANYDSAYNKFLDDMYFLAKEIAEDTDASSDDDEDGGENESLKEGKKLREGIDHTFYLEVVKKDGGKSDSDRTVYKGLKLDSVINAAKGEKLGGDEAFLISDAVTGKQVGPVPSAEQLEAEAKKIFEVKEITEAPNYELHPQYDSRKSFYGKARVDTGDKDDKNKLFSYDTLVAEIKDGKPVVYGAFSATTLRHIKDWLKQNGFKAENKAQILRDYGVKKEEKECEDGGCEKEECKEECKESVTESVEEVSVKTDKEDISVRTDEDGKVSVETSVKEETDEGAEEIAPVSDEVKAEIEDDSEEAEIGDEIDVEMTDFDEESFDELGEAYLKKAYSNVESYKSVSATANDNGITVEGVIKFKSGNEKKTKFVLESKEVTKSGKSRFVGENLQIAKGKKAFTVFGTLSEGRFVTESLGYDYRAKDKDGKSKRISGTVTKC